MSEVPPGWTNDSITGFFNTARNNELATFVHYPAEFALLREIHDVFQLSIEALGKNPGEIVPALFFCRSHSAFLAAARLAIAGQVVEAYPVLRSALEYAVYALHVNGDPTKGDVFLKKDDDPRRFRDEFAWGSVKKTLQGIDAKLFLIVDNLYTDLITWGAHPNAAGVLTGIERVKSAEGVEYTTDYFRGPGVELELVLKQCARVGVGCLTIYNLVYATRFALAGLDMRIRNLQKGL